MPTKKTVTSPKSRKPNPGTTPAPPTFWQRLRNGQVKADVTEFLKADLVRFVIGLSLLGISIYLLLSMISNLFTGSIDQGGVQSCNLDQAANYGGKLGAYLSFYFMDGCFGIASLFIPLLTLLIGIKLMGAYTVRLWKWFLNFSFLMIWSSVFFSLICQSLPDAWVSGLSFRLGGAHGDFIRSYLVTTLGTFGVWLLIISCVLLYFVYLTSETIHIVRRLLHPQDYINLKKLKRNKKAAAEPGESIDVPNEVEEEVTQLDLTPEEESARYEDETNEEEELMAKETDETVSIDLSAESSNTPAPHPIEATNSDQEAPKPSQVAGEASTTKLDIAKTIVDDKAKGKTVEEVKDLAPYDPRKDLEYYKFPAIPLLKHYDDQGPAIDMAEQNANKDRIIEVLRNFGVEISSIKATIGPTITLYEVTPAPGVRINKIRNLEDDIALSLSALGIRIIAPIPGKGTIGIEVPNKNPRIVSMESIINTKKFQESTFDLPIALGKTITNEVFMVDLAKMPHLLVAGATGQGKSVGLNAIITSLLYKKHPAELKLVMVDPKKVEFSIYTSIEKHFLAKIPAENEDPIITDVTKVVQTLKSLCQLMDARYDLLKKAKVRNIKEYNAKFKARQLNPENGHEFMPYIVVIIDEFGDLIMTAGKEVELPIARIAQLARAVGMHMIIATQRPTTNIITGTIKANFPARMAFKVMSQIDSRTILDQGGANQLVGKGDMLFLAANTPVRVQCAFVDTPEVERINEYISKQQGYQAAYELPEPEMEGEGNGPAELDSDSLDPMFEEAARLIVIHQQGSTSLIQRKFAIGYNRAGRLMDQLERAGIVGPVRGSKPREVLVADEIELDSRIQQLRG